MQKTVMSRSKGLNTIEKVANRLDSRIKHYDLSNKAIKDTIICTYGELFYKNRLSTHVTYKRNRLIIAELTVLRKSIAI